MGMAINGIYDGKNIKTEDSSKINNQKQALINELYGILQGTEMTLDEIRNERLKKYEIIKREGG